MLVHREAGPPDGPPVICLHGWPASSRMWDPVLEALGAAGLHALAPDLPGYGASPLQRPATWATHVAALEQWRTEQELEGAGLVVHDWGGLIGLRWACDHPEAVAALVLSDTGFFPDGKWHDLAATLRTPGAGEELLDGLTEEAFTALLRSASPGMTEKAIAAYFEPFTTPEGRAAQLELYRSGEFSELQAYEGRLAALGVPTLLLWGGEDPFAPVASAHRFAAELPGSGLHVLEGVGHFPVEDAPEAYAAACTAFLVDALAPRPAGG
jgi:haloalkane dehalogenase